VLSYKPSTCPSMEGNVIANTACRAMDADVLRRTAQLVGPLLGWLTERGGPQKPSPAELGTTGLTPLVGPPSTYVFES
jgi:hypothetical protein